MSLRVRGAACGGAGGRIRVMAEQAQELAGPALPRVNRGWFQRGDRRINREGRPRGSKATQRHRAEGVERAQRPDRLMVLVVPRGDLLLRLCRPHAPWIINLPNDFEVVGCRLDAARDMVLLIRSEAFPRVAEGAPIPEFEPDYNGLKFRAGW